MRDATAYPLDDVTEGDLYLRYRRYLDETRADILERTRPGSFRDRLLKLYRPLPREHFEARLEALEGNAEAYGEAIAALRRGFVPRRGDGVP